MILKNEDFEDEVSLEIEFRIPDQDSVDNGYEPYILASLQDGMTFSFDMYPLIIESIRHKEDADIYAEWIESWAEDIREQFNAPKQIKLARPNLCDPFSVILSGQGDRRIIKALTGHVETVGDLLSLSRDDLLKIKYIGRSALYTIDERIKASDLYRPTQQPV